MILGIYDDLITAVSRAFSEPRKNLLLLLKFAVGACAGALLIARLITFLLTTPVEVPLRFLFLGAVAGGIPMIFRKAEIRKLTAGSTALILAGVGVVMLISMLPKGYSRPTPRIRCGDNAVSRRTSDCGGAGAPGDKRVALSAYARDLR